MEEKKITKEKIVKLKNLIAEHEETIELLSENIKTVKAQHGEDKHLIERDGKKVEVEEKHLWTEVYHLGQEGHQASEILSKKYPDIFEIGKKESKMAKDISDFTVYNFGFDFKQMALGNLLFLIEELVKLEMEDCYKEKFNK